MLTIEMDVGLLAAEHNLIIGHHLFLNAIMHCMYLRWMVVESSSFIRPSQTQERVLCVNVRAT